MREEMEDKEAIEILKRLAENPSLTGDERVALSVAVGFMTLATHTRDGWVRTMKQKRDAGLADLDTE